MPVLVRRGHPIPYLQLRQFDLVNVLLYSMNRYRLLDHRVEAVEEEVAVEVLMVELKEHQFD